MANKIILLGGIGALLVVAIFAASIAFGGPTTPAPLASIKDAVAQRDRQNLPEILHFKARDGATLAYRAYADTATSASVPGVAVLIHGSVGSGADMNEVAWALGQSGVAAYAPDLRGHGASGTRGDIAYVGQLADDFSDFLKHLDSMKISTYRVLVGHSAGGGFALRVAASQLAEQFNRAILLAPFLAPDAPTNRPAGGWANFGLPRYLALDILQSMGLTSWGYLPVLAFAVDPAAAPYVTPAYSYRLTADFGAGRDWQSHIAKARIPLTVLVGEKDELFFADRFAQLFATQEDRANQVTVFPGVDHMGVTGNRQVLTKISAAATKSLMR